MLCYPPGNITICIYIYIYTYALFNYCLPPPGPLSLAPCPLHLLYVLSIHANLFLLLEVL